MPYINAFDRLALEPECATAKCAGDLNYQITRLCVAYLDTHRGYAGMNDVLGALEGAKLELYRRVVVPYENVKCNENGDVYGEVTWQLRSAE